MTADDKRRLARLRLRARQRHEGDLRRRALFLSLIVFGALWVAIFAQMVSGHDPVLATGTKTRRAVHSSSTQAGSDGASQSSNPDQVQTDEPAQSASGITTTQSVPAAPVQSTPAPVVTSQS